MCPFEAGTHGIQQDVQSFLLYLVGIIGMVISLFRIEMGRCRSHRPTDTAASGIKTAYVRAVKAITGYIKVVMATVGSALL
ncbi:Uncharacterised protein [Serratia rubidaea]|nr:Uncharacterised protein [Serratia rubidaea]